MRAFVRYIALPLVAFATAMIMINGSIGPAIVGIIIAFYLWVISRKQKQVKKGGQYAMKF